ncbi:MAG: bifunctional riboflavin kinase/FAD synthetase [Peptococcaceae bacterium]|nr:bifunctional riboflavin kinase/FAD synthetase [Peptococcaceae bacterium]
MTTRKFRTVVLGNFDGIHRGHQQLIHLGRQIADQNDEELAVFTFYPQIHQVVDPAFCYLLSEQQKLERFGNLRVDVVETVPFDETIATLSPEEFVKTILAEKLRARHIVVGFNYSFGHKGAGNPQLLQELAEKYQIAVTVMEPYQLDGELVCSTAIRQALRDGNVEQANHLLGYTYSIEGPVVHGNQIGRTIGFPTANIQPQEGILLPGNGVYAALTTVDGKVYPGILNIGLRPTIERSTGVNIEVNLFGFDDDIYGKTIRTELHYFLRSEKKFENLDALKAQLQQDKEETAKLFEEAGISLN